MPDQHLSDTSAPAVLDPPTADEATGPSPRRILSGRARKLAVGLTSLFVVLLGVGYVAAPSNPSLDMTIQELDSIPAYDVDLTAEYSLAAADLAAQRRYREVIWGLIVSPDGVPVTGAKLTLQGVSKKVRSSRATITIGGPKTFRSIVHLRPGRYKFTMTLRADGKLRSVSKTRGIKNNRFYGVGVVVQDGGIVTMVPIRTY